MSLNIDSEKMFEKKNMRIIERGGNICSVMDIETAKKGLYMEYIQTFLC